MNFLKQGKIDLKRVLNVGGNNKDIALPPQYSGYEQQLLDIDPRGKPDIVCDARDLLSLETHQFDAVYCSHNLEHYYYHDVPKVLAGFMHLLKTSGFVHVRVPDIIEVIRLAIERELDVEDVLYQSPAGPIKVLDVLYGYSVEIERSGQGFYAHKTGFTRKSLVKKLQGAGFVNIYASSVNLEINVLAFKQIPDQSVLTLFGLGNQ